MSKISEEFHRETLLGVLLAHSIISSKSLVLKNAWQVMLKVVMSDIIFALFRYITTPGWLSYVLMTWSDESGRQIMLGFNCPL